MLNAPIWMKMTATLPASILPEMSIEMSFIDHPCGFHGSPFAYRSQIGINEDGMNGIALPELFPGRPEPFEDLHVALRILFQPAGDHQIGQAGYAATQRSKSVLLSRSRFSGEENPLR